MAWSSLLPGTAHNDGTKSKAVGLEINTPLSLRALTTTPDQLQVASNQGSWCG